MMDHQIEFSRAIKEIYEPISGRVSDPDAIVHEGNDAGIEACNQYELAVKDLQATLAPELEMITTRVIAPADELLSIIKNVRKTTLKRQHKQLDYDRYQASFKKIKEKPEKSLKDEKALYKAEADLDQATQDFEYFNDLLKDELPQLFRLEREFIRPLFQSFYYMQLNVFYTLHEKMQSIDIGYFNLTLGIEEAFEAKMGDSKEKAEQLSITAYKKTGGKRPPGAVSTQKKYVSKYAIENGTAADPSTAITRRRSHDHLDNPPPYSPAMSTALASSNLGRASSTGSSWSSAAKSKGAAPPPPKPKPSRLSGVPAVTATALYDYEAQAEGDLSFSAGDVIEVTRKGLTENEWWSGRLNGKVGQFPGNYIKLD